MIQILALFNKTLFSRIIRGFFFCHNFFQKVVYYEELIRKIFISMILGNKDLQKSAKNWNIKISDQQNFVGTFFK